MSIDVTDIQPDTETQAAEPTAVRGISAYDAMVRRMLDDALGPRLRRRLRRHEPIALVLIVPSPEWIQPIARAIRRVRDWDNVWEADPKTTKRASGSPIAHLLAVGGSVVGIAHNVNPGLPAALVASADKTVVVSAPDNAAISAAIHTATGRRPRSMPLQVASGLDYLEIVSAIRRASTPAQCVKRLQAASKAASIADAAVGQAPPLETLHGYGEAKTFGMDLVADLERWRRGEIQFRDIRRCCVLASAPGLGKTSLVRAIAAAARIPLFPTSVGAWFSSTNGHLDAVIREFESIVLRAAAVAPAVILLDELDSLPSRARLNASGSRNSDYWAPLIGRILTLLDGATSGLTSQLVIIGATNHPDALDPAVVRPGRLERIITIHPPQPEELAAIMRQHLGDDLPGADLLPLGDLARGASGAQIVGWIADARSRARQAGRPFALADLTAVIAPPDWRSETERYRLALHEAGHAVVAHRSRPGCVVSASIVARPGLAGQVVMRSGLGVSPTRAEIEEDVVTTLAGRATEVVRLGSPSSGAGGDGDSDLGLATRALVGLYVSYGLADRLTHLGGPDEGAERLRYDAQLRATVEEDLRRLHGEAERRVRADMPAIEAVARELLSCVQISGAKVQAIVAQHEPVGLDRRGKSSPTRRGI